MSGVPRSLCMSDEPALPSDLGGRCVRAPAEVQPTQLTGADVGAPDDRRVVGALNWRSASSATGGAASGESR